MTLPNKNVIKKKTLENDKASFKRIGDVQTAPIYNKQIKIWANWIL